MIFAVYMEKIRINYLQKKRNYKLRDLIINFLSKIKDQLFLSGI